MQIYEPPLANKFPAQADYTSGFSTSFGPCDEPCDGRVFLRDSKEYDELMRTLRAYRKQDKKHLFRKL
jgi:hypothetical protein